MTRAQQLVERLLAEASQCCAQVRGGTTCTRGAVAWRSGQPYCYAHDPDRSHLSMPHARDRRRRVRWTAESIIEDEDDDVPLGPSKTKEVDSVTIFISGEGAGRFREFMQGIAKVCNQGSSREVAIVDPASPDERALTWSFDGDGDTKIEVRDSMAVSARSIVEAASRAIPATMYHLADEASFKLDPTRRPENNSTLGGDWEPGIFLGDSVEHWVNGYGYWRPWVVEFDTSALRPEDLAFGHESGEVLVKAAAFPRLRIKRVVPLDAHCREVFGECGWTEQYFGTDFRTGEPIDCAPRALRGYRYPGDARREPAEWRSAYAKRVKEYAAKSGRGNGVYGT